MKVTFNNKDYYGIQAWLIGVPVLLLVGGIFLIIGSVFLAPVLIAGWLLIQL